MSAAPHQSVYLSRTRSGIVGLFTGGRMAMPIDEDMVPRTKEEARALAERYFFLLDDDWNRL